MNIGAKRHAPYVRCNCFISHFSELM